MTRFEGSSRPSAALVVAVIALAFAITGVGYAATKIGTKQLDNGAVTTKKLHKKAVTGGKLASSAVKGGKLQDGAVKAKKLAPSIPGIAVAGVSVRRSGEVISSFNRFGGPVSVRHSVSGNGLYFVEVPGLTDTDDFIFGNLAVIPVASLTEGGEITASSTFGREAAEVVNTYDSGGTPADRSFNWTIYTAG
jgi:hypothetical protein